MSLLQRRTMMQKEWDLLMKKEAKFLKSLEEKKDSVLNRMLAEKVPDKLQETLDTAFFKAFTLIFEKGTGVIEKTYRKEKLEREHKINQYADELTQSRKSLRTFSKKASAAGTRSVWVSGASGIGMGALGVGIPDIPIFTGLILRNLYETAVHYGYDYETEAEQYFILLLIRGAVSFGETQLELDREINRFIAEETLPEAYEKEAQIRETAGMLSKELLYMKFLQGVPVVGAVGGAYDVIYMKRISEYANLKYQRRFLQKKISDFIRDNSQKRDWKRERSERSKATKGEEVR